MSKSALLSAAVFLLVVIGQNLSPFRVIAAVTDPICIPKEVETKNCGTAPDGCPKIQTRKCNSLGTAWGAWSTCNKVSTCIVNLNQPKACPANQVWCWNDATGPQGYGTCCPVQYQCMSSKPAGQQYCYYPSGGGSPTPTPTPTPTTRPSVAPSASPKVTPSPSPSPIVAASCRMIVMYTTAWKPLTDFSTFKTGNQFYMCTYGSANTGEFTKARFTVNAELRAETTLKMPGTTNYFCDLYTVPATTYDFVVTSEVYHSILGWRQ